MADNLVWFIWSLGLLVIWLAVFVFYRTARTRILLASLLTMLFGLSEPIFVPEYWNPPSLFDLTQKTGFDIESLLFCFAIGGMGIVIYDLMFKIQHEKMDWTERHDHHHRFHFWTLVSPFIVFGLLYFLTDLNPIYSASLSMFAGGLAALWCRPDLKLKIWGSGLMFTLFYFVYFLPLVLFIHFGNPDRRGAP